MQDNNGFLSVKLYEMDRQYQQMQARLQLCRHADHEKVRQSLRQTVDEYEENSLILQRRAQNSRAPAMTALSEAQLIYCQTIQGILEQEVAACQRQSDSGIDSSEILALYAECAVDFANQTMHHVLISALTAMDMQMNFEEERKYKP